MCRRCRLRPPWLSQELWKSERDRGDEKSNCTTFFRNSKWLRQKIMYRLRAWVLIITPYHILDGIKCAQICALTRRRCTLFRKVKICSKNMYVFWNMKNTKNEYTWNFTVGMVGVATALNSSCKRSLWTTPYLLGIFVKILLKMQRSSKHINILSY